MTKTTTPAILTTLLKMGIFMEEINRLTNNANSEPKRQQPLPANIEKIMERSEGHHKDSSIHALISGCQREAYEGREQERGYCFELFRRALQENNEKAWEAIEQQYWSLISSWCFEHLKQETPGFEVDIFVRSALIRFWQTLSTRQETLENKFSHIGAILKYLRQCTATVIHDHNREVRRRNRLHEACTNRPTGIDPRSFEDHIVEEMEQSQLIERIANWVKVYVEDDREKLVLQLSYEDGLTPRKIAAQYEDQFSSVTEVHQIKERVVRRLRRAMQDYE